MPVGHDLTGRRFGKLTVIEFTGTRTRRRYKLWRCRCDCGEIALVDTTSLVSGNTKSCGCLIEHHKLRFTAEYRIWAAMKTRCYNPNSVGFARYGGRGIFICDEWLHSFQTFYHDMGPRPSSSHTIERLDNDGPYSKANCVWATRKQQNRNKENSRRITYKGETLSLAEWTERLGASESFLKARLKRGWSVQKAIETPPRRR